MTRDICNKCQNELHTKNEEMTKLILEFIVAVKKKYPMEIFYKYDLYEDQYNICRNFQQRVADSYEFDTFVGDLMDKIFHDKGIYNFCFYYDYDFDLIIRGVKNIKDLK